MPPSSNGVSLSNTSRINADIYGDGSLIDLSGQSMICGIVLGDSYKLSGTSAIHVDISLLGGGSTGSADHSRLSANCPRNVLMASDPS